MIGWYVHHVGRGHLHRALAVAAELDEPVTGLSSLPRPAGWAGPWLQLARDDTAVPSSAAGRDDPTAGGRLHWVPVGHPGLRERMAQISAWIAAEAPALFVSDVSVEVALLARLHGVPVVTVALPGRRDDEAHRLGFAVSSLILSAWPPTAEGMLIGLDETATARHLAVGAIARFRPGVGDDPPVRSESAPNERRRVLVLNGGGDSALDADQLARARASTPEWSWTVIGGPDGRWVADPWPLIRTADVVVTHAGQNALAEVAAARRPAIVMPRPRPHDEQLHTAAALARGPWPALVLAHPADTDWPRLLAAALGLDGTAWTTWNDGDGASRAAVALSTLAAPAPAASEALATSPSPGRSA